MQARQYQLDQIDKAVEEVSAKQRVLIQLPTGGGKTYEFALIAQRFVRNSSQQVLILVDRKELMYQAAKTINEICDIDAYLITSKSKHFTVSRVIIGMVESVVRRTHLFDNVGLIVIDECHMANFNKVHHLYPDLLIIGVTATPKSSSKKDPLNKYYNSIVVGPQISELIKYGYLAQNITRCPDDIVKASAFTIDKLSGDYNEAQMAMEYKKPRHITNVVRQYQKFCEGKKTLVYNVTVDHSKEVNNAFVLCGYNSRHLDATASDEERAETLKWFKETEDAILNNVGLFTKGFDEPTIINIIPNFSTISIVKWLQVCGRGGRIINEDFIKKHQHEYPYNLKLKYHFNIIDLGGNAPPAGQSLGDWNDDRDWKYIFENPEVPGEGVAPTKICPQCSGLIHAALSICPLSKENGDLCQYEFVKKKVAEEKEQEMVIVTKGINIPELIEKNTKKHPYYNFLKMGEDIVNNLFREFKNPSETIIEKAFVKYYELCKEWYNATMSGVDDNILDISTSQWHITRARNNFNNLVNLKKKNAIPYEYTEMTNSNFIPHIPSGPKYEGVICGGCGDEVDVLPDGEFCEDCIRENKKLEHEMKLSSGHY